MTSEPAPARLRPATPADAFLIGGHRARMFLEAGFDRSAVEAMSAHFLAWVERGLGEGWYRGILAQRDRETVGGIGILVQDWPPHPHHPAEGRRGYVLNLFVDPAARRAGIGSCLLAAAEDALGQVPVRFATLHPTRAALPLYRGAGWAPTGELGKQRPPDADAAADAASCGPDTR